MNTTKHISLAFTAILLALPPALWAVEQESAPVPTLNLNLQSRSEDGTPRLERESWRADQTAIIVCDRRCFGFSGQSECLVYG